MKEIEAKILEIDRKQVLTQLMLLGAVEEFKKEFYAIYYDTPDRALTTSGKVIRLRKEGDVSVLTYKERSDSTEGIKVMEEHESIVEDFEAVQLILSGLGYVPTLNIRKVRTQYQLGKVHIVIDEMLDDHSNIPEFIEVEAGSLEEVEEIAGKLGFDKSRLSNMSVADLADHYQKKTHELD